MEGELWGAQHTGSRTVRSEFINCYTGRFAAALLDLHTQIRGSNQKLLRNKRRYQRYLLLFGGAYRIRTGDLYTASVAR